MNPCTNGCQPPRSALFFRCPDRLIDPGSYVPLLPSSRVDPCRMSTSYPFLLPNRPSCSLHVLPAPYRHSRDGGNLASCLPSFPLPIVIPALYRHSRDGGNLAPCVRRLSIEVPATRYFDGAEPVAVRCGLAMAERTLSTIFIRTTRRVWFCGRRIPRTE